MDAVSFTDPSVSRDDPVTSVRALFIWECGILVIEGIEPNSDLWRLNSVARA